MELQYTNDEKNAEGPVSDGEFYYVTALLFAANRRGNITGINYYKEARRILDASWQKDGTGSCADEYFL